MPNQKGKIKARRAIGLIGSGELFQSTEETDKIAKTKTTKIVRAIFSPWRVLKEIDLSDQGGHNITIVLQYTGPSNIYKK